MGTAIEHVTTVDLSKAHHYLVVQSRKHDVLHVTCVDCDDDREYPYRHLATFISWLTGQEDIQVLSWIDVDASS